MWHKSRWLALPAFLAAVLLTVAGDSWGQPPGGFNRKGGGFGKGNRMNPDAIWDNFAKGKSSIGPSDPQYGMITQIMQSRGQMIAPNAPVSKEQFRTAMQSMNRGGGDRGGKGGRGGAGDRGGRFGGGARPGGPGGGPGGSPPVMFTTGQDGRVIMTQGGPGGGRPVVVNGQDMRFQGGMPNSNIFEGPFKRYDRNGDGRVTQEEATPDMARDWGRYDRNRDGAVTLEEYTSAMQERFNRSRGNDDDDDDDDDRDRNRRRDDRDRNDRQDQRGDRSSDGDQSEEIARPVVHRYGKLPKEMPSWFTRLDTDKDGMVGLYEWRRDTETKREIKEFANLDLNNDGYLTADEWLRQNRETVAKKDGNAKGNEGNRPARGGRGERPGGRGNR